MIWVLIWDTVILVIKMEPKLVINIWIKGVKIGSNRMIPCSDVCWVKERQGEVIRGFNGKWLENYGFACYKGANGGVHSRWSEMECVVSRAGPARAQLCYVTHMLPLSAREATRVFAPPWGFAHDKIDDRYDGQTAPRIPALWFSYHDLIEHEFFCDFYWLQIHP
jgi:hypothetical protein